MGQRAPPRLLLVFFPTPPNPLLNSCKSRPFRDVRTPTEKPILITTNQFVVADTQSSAQPR
eukprot:m.428274 g.428274  ORF g.428274 m.428274 type:complete len:61 (-) comp16865_c0_seq19:797-979(-)